MLPEPPTKPPELSSGEAKSLRLMRELDDHDVHGFFDLRVVGRICGSFPPWIAVRWYQKAGIWWFVTFSHFPKSEVVCRIKTVGGTATSRPVAGEKKKTKKNIPNRGRVATGFQNRIKNVRGFPAIADAVQPNMQTPIMPRMSRRLWQGGTPHCAAPSIGRAGDRRAKARIVCMFRD